MHKLCLTLAEESLEELQRKIYRHSGQVPLIEVRLDYLLKPELPVLPSATSSRFIATLRPVREGGKFNGSEGDRLKMLRDAACQGFDWLDLELDVKELEDLPPRVSILRSYHDFESLPSDLSGLYRQLRQARGDAVKMAVSVASTSQLAKLLRFMESLPQSPPRVVIGMGGMGRISRILSQFLGNCWSYLAEQERDVAPGQIAIDEARKLYRMDSWNTCPELYGVIGNPVRHSRSPWLHNQLFQAYSLPKLYVPVLLDELDSWFAYLENSRLPFSGFSITLPFKEKAAKFAVSAPGHPAINTLRRTPAGWQGLNTDWEGFLRPLLARGTLQGKTAVVLGNGGVAHTVVAALRSQGAQVQVAGRDRDRVAKFAGRYGCPWCLVSEFEGRADLCVNATPVGQDPETDESPLRESQLRFELVYDLVYNPLRTRLMKMAERRGIQTVSGLEMFLEQAALQFHFWTGIEPERRLLRELFDCGFVDGGLRIADCGLEIGD